MTGILLAGCVTDAEMEAYYREQCLFDRVTFKKIEPGSPEFEYCLELYRSGLGGYENDIHGGAGLGQFAD
ncbi:MAG: hypothetical protein RIB59_12135 [Rhodospirillales bacterium]